MTTPSVLFVCVHNAGRSQMAAGFLTALSGGAVEVRSAGSMPADQVNPVAVDAMAEVGIDIRAEQPKVLTTEAVQASDVVVTMGCGDACPYFPGKRYEDWVLEDPAGQGIDSVRPIRDEIRGRMLALLDGAGRGARQRVTALVRRLGVADAVVVGLGAMLGAGVFAAFGPAAQAAGTGLLIGLAIAAVVAFCNATSSARLAALLPGVRRDLRLRAPAARTLLGVPGRLVVRRRQDRELRGDGAHVRHLRRARPRPPGRDPRGRRHHRAQLPRRPAVGAAQPGDRRAHPGDARRRRGGVPGGRHRPRPSNLTGVDLGGILQSAGLLFFAFAGYARIATLGEEVVDPRRTIPRAIPLALGIVLVVYLVVGVSALLAVGADGLAATTAPLRAVVEAGSFAALEPGRAGRRGRRVPRRAAGADARGVPHDPRDGARARAARRSSRPSTPGTGCRTARSWRSRPS